MKILLLSLFIASSTGMQAMQQLVPVAGSEDSLENQEARANYGALQSYRMIQNCLVKALLNEYSGKFRELVATHYPKGEVYDSGHCLAVTRYSQMLSDLAKRYHAEISAISPLFLTNVTDLTRQIRGLPTEQQRREAFLNILKSHRQSMREIHETKHENEKIFTEEEYERRCKAPRLKNELAVLGMESGIKIDQDIAFMTDEELKSLADSFIF